MLIFVPYRIVPKHVSRSHSGRPKAGQERQSSDTHPKRLSNDLAGFGPKGYVHSRQLIFTELRCGRRCQFRAERRRAAQDQQQSPTTPASTVHPTSSTQRREQLDQ